MADVVFTHSYMLRRDPKQWADGAPYPPRATIQAAALVRERGWNVALFDPQLEESTQQFARLLDHERPRAVFIYDDGFNYLTKMCLTNMRDVAFELAREGGEAGATIIMWSSDATDHAELFLRNGVDVVILGEAEQTVVDLLHCLDTGGSLLDVPGNAMLVDGTVVRTAPRTVMKDLDVLPMPAWDLIDVAAYTAFRRQHGHRASLHISTTRGCPFQCNWCAKPIYGSRYTSHSPDWVANEMAYLAQTYGIDHVWFCDDIFGLKPGWVEAFTAALEQRSLKIPFTIQSRADLLVRGNTASDLARAGCERVWIGAESGSQSVLDAMDKGITVAQIEEAVRRCRQHNISPALFLQFGYPGETMHDIRATLDMIRSLVPDEIGVSVSYPLPGTPFYESVKHELTEKANWTDSDDLAIMFSNTYDVSFYRQLQRHAHVVVRMQQGLRAFTSSTRMRRHWKRALLLPYYAGARAIRWFTLLRARPVQPS